MQEDDDAQLVALAAIVIAMLIIIAISALIGANNG